MSTKYPSNRVAYTPVNPEWLTSGLIVELNLFWVENREELLRVNDSGELREVLERRYDKRMMAEGKEPFYTPEAVAKREKELREVEPINQARYDARMKELAQLKARNNAAQTAPTPTAAPDIVPRPSSPVRAEDRTDS